ncbi:sugar-phosphatase [Bradyrhizobium japonicum]|uniref:HAD-IA family hydrolase n=1 Tax=Bradyrhizobium japonicum TaxID=375 RepID=UPI0021686CBE|nr:HAD-IA family hydrolase [Bradyrhizobium japonicum]MCS3502247.1 sugar-phosphatase [Bradyrhizobium japonicum]MCS3965039.1 sugar-phosphatase [Bradyrhizobium japonicum]MCS3997346.1 sugar-phosphatase [Bradyrhizobium japonicum]
MTSDPLRERVFEALLFDMDGTVLTSILAAERVWTSWAVAHGLDVEAFLPTIHGVRAVETIRRLALPGIDAEVEAAVITAREMEDLTGVEAIAGAAALLTSLPPDRWAIVTSAPRELALRRLSAAGLPIPNVIVTAEDVELGKPAPDCFIRAAEMLGFAVTDCIVFEDAPAGIEAAKTAGATIVVVTATHSDDGSHHPFALANFATVRVVATPSGGLLLDLAGIENE